MKIEANDKEVRDIFSLGYFKIPRFQRPYSWSEEEVNNFWDDVVIEDNDQYFIGSMVVYQTEKPYFGIVDGQQRLTTITLMLAAIRNAFRILGDENLSIGVHNYIEKPTIDNVKEFILNSETSFPYLQAHIQSFEGAKVNCKVGHEELKLKNAFELINKKLSSFIPGWKENNAKIELLDESRLAIIDRLKTIRNKILSLKLVFIQLDNEDDAYLIFETLNTRGKDLTTPDLVKNLFLKKVQSSNKTLDNAKIIWNNILDKFDDYGIENAMTSFLHHHWLSKYADTTEQKLFGEIKKHIPNSDAAFSLLIEFQQNADYYASIRSPNNYSWTPEENDLKECLEAFNILSVKQQMPMVLSLIRAYREQNLTLRALLKILRKIESFHFIFNKITSQHSSGSISSIYYKNARDLTQTNNHDKIQSIFSSLSTSLKSKLAEFEEFEIEFTKLIYTKSKTRNRKVITYILSRFMGKNINGLPIDYEFTSIEHILPQSKECNEDVVGSIGNLILVDRKTNSEELKNLDFPQKINILRNKGYPIDSDLLNANQWTETEIINRAKSMAHKAFYELWSI
ncbi:DUF262 domain-containing HNH endonuclease family protein [Microcoleus sp. MON2_D6]|uniref:DUF262 domain-containing HNH endonuclease family protein n=1 Tax=unclassified Microcoleus TaxID=2642155 RepID=UPI002FD66189